MYVLGIVLSVGDEVTNYTRRSYPRGCQDRMRSGLSVVAPLMEESVGRGLMGLSWTPAA